MKKQVERKEYLPKKVASTFWWDSFGWQLLFGIVMSLCLSFATRSLVQNYAETLSNKMTQEVANLKMSELGYEEYLNQVATIQDKYEKEIEKETGKYSWISYVLAFGLIYLAVKKASKKVERNAIIREEKIPEIMKKYSRNTYILYGLAIVVACLPLFAGTTAVVTSIVTIIVYIGEAVFQNYIAKSLLNKMAVAELTETI